MNTDKSVSKSVLSLIQSDNLSNPARDSIIIG